MFQITFHLQDLFYLKLIISWNERHSSDTFRRKKWYMGEYGIPLSVRPMTERQNHEQIVPHHHPQDCMNWFWCCSVLCTSSCLSAATIPLFLFHEPILLLHHHLNRIHLYRSFGDLCISIQLSPVHSPECNSIFSTYEHIYFLVQTPAISHFPSHSKDCIARNLADQ